MIFHLVSRTHRHERWFVPELRDEIAGMIPRVVARTDARLLAYVVMANHLHILLRQGQQKLEEVMQPLLRRVALRVQRFHGFEGTVVERQYRDRPVESADHAREAFLYLTLNPWRAGLCDGGLAYAWSTHAAYLPGADPAPFGIDPEAQLQVLSMFALGDSRTRDQLCRNYLTWLEWRMERGPAARRPDRELEPEDRALLPRPDTRRGDEAWRRHFGPLARYEFPGRPPLPDLRDFVAAQVARLPKPRTIEELRGSWGSHERSRDRGAIIRAAAKRGYRTGDLARFFNVSPAAVSRAKYRPG